MRHRVRNREGKPRHGAYTREQRFFLRLDFRAGTAFLLLSVSLLMVPNGFAQEAAPPVASGSVKPQVLFQRSTDSRQAPGEANAGTHPVLTAASPESGSAASAVTDQMRSAPVFTSYDLAVHLAPAQASLAVQARLTLRNGGTQPLKLLPLQLSSTLHMDHVALAGTRLPIVQHQIASDADHTGQLEETAVTLPQPLAPGASITLTVAYSGTIEPSAARLDRLQTPADLAAQSDWDRISEEFTGLRGFGDVVWYPVCSLAARLGEGAKLSEEIGRQRARNQDALIKIQVTDEFSGPAPSIAALAGHVLDPGTPQTMPNASFPGVLRFELPAVRLGFRMPSLFLAGELENSPADRPTRPDLLRVYSTPSHAAYAPAYQAAAGLVEPLLTQWLATSTGQQTASGLAIIDLPVEGAQPSEQGDALLASLVAAQPAEIAPLLSRELARVLFHSPRAWLAEGVPALMSNLYLEQTQGRAVAMEQLAASRGALALAEPASPGAGAGQSLIEASDAIYYQSKALYVLSMLRDVAGDKALAAALRAYDPSADTQPEYFEKLVEQASASDLRWFFNAWVYHDTGLPDLSIANVYSSRTGTAGQADQWLVSVDVANDGYAEAEVPVTVHSAATAVTEHLRIAARGHISRRLLIVGEPVSVDVNDGTVPEVQASVHERLLK